MIMPMIEFLKKLFQNEKIRFIFAGGTSFLVDFIVTNLLGVILPKADLVVLNGITLTTFHLIANPIGVTVASIYSFLVNKHFTFKIEGNTKKQSFYFAFNAILAICVFAPVISYISTDWLGLRGLWVVPIRSVIILVWNYFFYKYIAFKK